MKRILILSLCLLGLATTAWAQNAFVVAIDQDYRDEWNVVADEFQEATGIRVQLQPFPRASVAQQIVIQAQSRSGKIHFAMLPNNWGFGLARYLTDLSDAVPALASRGIEPFTVNGQPLGVPLPFAEDTFLAVLSWPDDFDAAVEFLLAAAGSAPTTAIGPTTGPGVVPLGILNAITRSKGSVAEHNPRLDGALESLIDAATATVSAMSAEVFGALPSTARAAVESVAELFGVPFSAEEATVTVVLESRPGRSASNVAALGALGVGRQSIEATSSLIKVTVPISELASLASQLTGVSFIRAPYKPYTLGTPSEGPAAIGADAFHTAGYTGAGTKVAIIDLGFSGLSQAQARGDLPYSAIQNDLTGTGMSGGISHGTAVAEIVHDVAPDAQLYLIRIGDEVDLDLAVTYCLNNGIDIINHSLGWYNTNFYDGTGTIADIARRAINGGILWVNAAGNEAESHWEGSFQDGNSDGWHDQTFSVSATAGIPIILYLTWNEWGGAGTDYDLYLYNPSGTLVASSTKHQTGTEEPTESIHANASVNGTYTIRIAGSGSRRLELYNLYQNLSPAVASSSILAPANVSEVVTVGAVDHTLYTTGPQQPYSSQGPTNDGRTKPDLVAPDNVATGTTPYAPFPGTSGAAPHASGAAALLLSLTPTVSEPALRAELLSQTIAMGSSNIYGSGRLALQLPGPTPQPPVAAFSFSPSSPNMGAAVSFNAGASYDPDGSIVAYTWQFGDGTTGSGITTAHAYAAPGTYTVTLTVTDNSGATDSTTRSVTVSPTPNQAPVAAFTFSPSSPTVGATVSFNAAGSYDPDGSLVAYAWQFGDGTSGSGITSARAYAVPGTYTVTLTVTDNNGATNSTTRSVTVSPTPNQAPVAAFTFSPSSPTTGTAVAFSAAGSYDPDGSLVAYAWQFGDGGTGSGVTASHAYSLPGTYTVTLTVTDNNGATNSTTRSVTVSPTPNQAPVASFTFSPSSPTVGAAVSFNAGASYDPDGSLVAYAWQFGDGSTGSGIAVAHAYASAGTYTATLTVTDNNGAVDIESRQVIVSVPAVPDLVIQSLTASPTSPTLGQSVTFTVVVRNAGTASAGQFRVRLTGTAASTTAIVSSLSAGATRTLSLVLPLSTSPETFTATADDLGQVAESNEGNNTQSLTVTAAAVPPTADANGPYSGSTGSPVQFDGSGSSGVITTYLWNFGDGSSAQGVSPTHTYALPGTYTITLTVFGSGGLQSSDTTQAVITTPQPDLSGLLSLPKSSYEVGEVLVITYSVNRPAYVYIVDVSPTGQVVLLFPNALEPNPLVAAGSHSLPGAPYTLRITEPVGTETLYMFAAASPLPNFPTTFGSGFPLLSTNPTSFRNSVLSTMQSQLPSSDWSFDTLSFAVVAAPPTTGTVRVLSSPSSASVTLDGTPIGATPTERAGVSPGIHTVQISRAGYETEVRQVTVTAGLTSTVSVTLTPIPSNQAPNAAFTFSPTSPTVGEPVQFNATGSNDPDGSIVSYEWDFDDGNTDTGAIVSHGFSGSTTYTVRLTVTDNEGATDTVTHNITVEPTPDVGWISPVAHEDPADAWANEDHAYDNDVEGSNASYPGLIASFEWTSFLFLDAPEGGIQSDRVRFIGNDAFRGHNVLDWDVDVFRDGEWVDVFDGPIEELEWAEILFDEGLVTRMRLRASVNRQIASRSLVRIWEADFRDATVPLP